MAKTTLKLWASDRFLVDVESTEVLSSTEKEIVTEGLEKACGWIFLGEPLPNAKEVRDEIDRIKPGIFQKLTRVRAHH